MYIIHPLTQERVYIHSKIGIQLLKKYICQYQEGGVRSVACKWCGISGKMSKTCPWKIEKGEPINIVKDEERRGHNSYENFLKFLETKYGEDCDKILQYKALKEEDEFHSKYELSKEVKPSLIRLLEIIKNKKKKNVTELLELYIENTTKYTDFKITRQHVFDALWNIIFLLRYDDILENDYERTFYEGIESRKRKKITDIIDHFQNTKIHGGPVAGIADIYFEQEKKQDEDNEDGEEDGEDKCIESHKKEKSTKTSYIFSAKYYKKEHSINKYDISDIRSEMSGLANPRVIILCKDKSALEEKKSRTRKAIGATIMNDDIYGMKDLQLFYNKLLLDLLKHTGTLEEFIQSRPHENKIKNELKLRIHQKYFVKYTRYCISQGKRLFIWGAVPRSGKSYIIAGFIEKHKPKNVIIILGAKSETETQFRDMFKNEFKETFKNYNINTFADIKDSKKTQVTYGEQNIILASAQILLSTTDSQLDKLLKLKNKVVFFDEAHYGSKADKSITKRINIIKENVNTNKEPLIFVTATFQSPRITYGISKKQQIEVLKWSYLHNLKMRSLDDYMYTDESNKLKSYKSNELKNMIKQENNGNNKWKALRPIIKDEIKYRTLREISEEYQKQPLLQVISPFLEHDIIPGLAQEDQQGIIKEQEIDMRSLFKLNRTRTDFTNKAIFNKFLDFIMNNIYNDILKGRMGYDIFNEQRSQIWFLPTMSTNKKVSSEEESEINKKESRHIEPLTRLLAEKLMEHKLFRKYFCVLIIHGQKITGPGKGQVKSFRVEQINADYDKLQISNEGESKDNKPCVSTICSEKQSDLKGCIIEQECRAKKNNKGLIILTGNKLRLGISLPNVDIALHMDPIKSFDTIYQSMFRVLTENKKSDGTYKDRGFFIDLVKNRSIKFIYKLANEDVKNNQNKKSTLMEDMEDMKRSILIDYNLNGYASFNMNDQEYNNLGETLETKMKLKDVNEFAIEYEKHIITESLSKEINNLDKTELDGYINQMKDIYELMNIKARKGKKSKKVEIVVKPGDVHPGPGGGVKQPKVPNTDPKIQKKIEKERKILKEKFQDFIKMILVMYSLLIVDDETSNANCKFDLSKLKKVVNIENDCKINTQEDIENKSILGCYIYQMELANKKTKFNEEDFKKLQDKYFELIENFYKNNKDIVNKLYCDIRKKILLSKDNMDKHEDILKSCIM